MGVPGGDYRSKADNVRVSSTGFVVSRARLGAMDPQLAVRSWRRSYLASTPGKTTPLATNAVWLPLVVHAVSHPAHHRYIISRAPCPSEGDLYWRVAGCTSSLTSVLFIYTEKRRCSPAPGHRSHWRSVVCLEHEPSMVVTLFYSIDPSTPEAAYVIVSLNARVWFTRNLLWSPFLIILHFIMAGNVCLLLRACIVCSYHR